MSKWKSLGIDELLVEQGKRLDLARLLHQEADEIEHALVAHAPVKIGDMVVAPGDARSFPNEPCVVAFVCVSRNYRDELAWDVAAHRLGKNKRPMKASDVYWSIPFPAPQPKADSKLESAEDRTVKSRRDGRPRG